MIFTSTAPIFDSRALRVDTDREGVLLVDAFTLRRDLPFGVLPRITEAEVTPSGEHIMVSFEDGVGVLLDTASFMAPSLPDLLVRNIGQLLTLAGTFGVGLTKDCALLIGQGQVMAIGSEGDLLQKIPRGSTLTVIDAKGRCVSPGLVDAHTHPVFAGNRAKEFSLRLSGATYEEIQAAGGGIHNSANQTRLASEEELFREASGRIRRAMGFGVTSFEAKSGYALTSEGELKSLRVIKMLNLLTPATLSPSLLAAHVVPREYAHDRSAYVRLITDEILPRVAQEKLATACDVFCETSAFSLEEAREILSRASELGIRPRAHAGQFNALGAVSMAAQLGALSVDHLEQVSEEEMGALAASRTVATLLPGAALTLGMKPPSARRFLDRGIPVALATDMNPGTSMTENLPLMASLGCMQMGMTVDEAWRAITINGAQAAGLQRKGQLSPGHDADFVIWEFDDYVELPYHFGTKLAARVFSRGREVQL